MKFATIALVLLMTIAMTALAQDTGDRAAAEKAIEEAALNYVEGWYEGNPERMEKALHPDLCKRAPRLLKQSGRTFLNTVSASNMVEYTRAGLGKLKEGEEMENQFILLDLYENIATVKLVSRDYVDYLHLAKFDDGWKIVNVLWVPLQKAEGQ
jgi:hypothetical protein